MRVRQPLAVGAETDDIRPRVRLRSGGGAAAWVFAAALAALALMLFVTLESRRDQGLESSIEPLDQSTSGRISSPPDLFIPTPYASADTVGLQTPFSVSAPRTARPTSDGQVEGVVASPRSAQRPSRPPRSAPFQPAPLPYVAPIQQSNYQPIMPSPPPIYTNQAAGGRQDRVSAYRFGNPATTVPKGTIIQAVLETALDSTRPGNSRAIVSRDVVGFDGSQILIPRGSRLFGEYAADLAPGQNRVLIQWQRLMRPDGITIDLNSPSSDPLGQAGIKGEVNSHFAERFASAILQTLVSVGSQVAINRIASGNVVYAIPISGQNLPISSPDKIQRTLKVRHGASVSVFVAKDLDFTGFDQ